MNNLNSAGKKTIYSIFKKYKNRFWYVEDTFYQSGKFNSLMLLNIYYFHRPMFSKY